MFVGILFFCFCWLAAWEQTYANRVEKLRMDLFMIALTSPISDDYSNLPLPNIRDVQCSMHQPRTLTSDIIVYVPQLSNK